MESFCKDNPSITSTESEAEVNATICDMRSYVTSALCMTKSETLPEKERALRTALCSRCAQINLPDLSTRAKTSVAEYDFLVGYTPRAWQLETCPLCCTLRTLNPNEDRIASLQIRGASAAAYYTGTNRGSSPLALTVTYEQAKYEEGRLKVPKMGLILAQPRTPEITQSVQGVAVDQDRVDTKLLKSWLTTCDLLRCSVCKGQARLETLSIPLKCIDCVNRQVVTIEPDDEYFALSYVWGNTVQVRQTSESPATHTVVPERCSQVVNDAIQLVKTLGKRYLWVDYICIDQQDHDSKAIQILEMDHVYAGAYVTIIACAGNNADYGLAGVSRPRRYKQPSAIIGDLKLYSTMPRLSHAISDTSWNSRGWTYQEAVLSKRCLFFTEHQVYFVCQSMTRCEAVGVATEETEEQPKCRVNRRRSSIASAIFHADPHNTVKSPVQDLTDHITEYTRRILKYDSDALDAFRGLLSRSPIYTFYGVPVALDPWDIMPCSISCDNAFAKGLNWIRGPLVPHKSRSTLTRRPEFPSWSWAGWKGCAMYASSTHKAPNDSEGSTQSINGFKRPSFWLEDTATGHRMVFQEVLGSVHSTRIIPELTYSLVIEADVFTFSFQIGEDDRLCWCPCHPSSSHGGKVAFSTSPWKGARPDFFENPACGSDLYNHILSRNWDCLLLVVNEREEYRGTSFRVLDLMIVEWMGDVAYRVGNLSVARRMSLELWQTRRTIRLG